MVQQAPRYGLSLPNRGVLFGATSSDELLEVSEQAEASGAFDSVWVGDSLFAKPRLEPKPLQKPCPPTWIATNPKPELTRSHVMEGALRRVGLMADGWMTDNTPVDRFKERWALIRQIAREAGRSTEPMESALHLM